MEMCIKERLSKTLQKRNFFDTGKKDSFEVLERAQHLEDIYIRVERFCNVDKLFFRYNPSTGHFHRVTPTENDQELLRRESKYDVSKSCMKRQCFNQKIDVDSFIKLLEYSFEPIGIYAVNEI